jgi:hypothetical protein
MEDRRMSIARHLTLTLSLCTIGCSDEPVVDVSTHVGPSHARNDETLRREHARTVAATVLAGLVPRAGSGSSDAAAITSEAPVHPPTDAAGFTRVVEALREASLDEIGGPARRLAAAGPEVWPSIRAALLAARKAPKGDYRSLLDAIGADVPNRYGHFARAWKKAHGFDVKLSQDWFEDLLSLPTGRVVPGLRAVYRDCVLQVALLRAASAVGRADPALAGEVVATLLDAAYALEGTFRDEVGRAIVALGDEAVPHLLRASDYTAPPRRDDREDPAALRAEYARLQLDKMDRLHPERATTAVREDPRRLVALLDTYAIVRPVEAAAVLLELADAAEPAVRDAARAAFTAYVEGPPPAARGRTIRLLGGGTSTAFAHLTYRQRAAIAIRERMQADVPALLEPECELKREDGTTDSKCEGQPERHAKAYLAWLHERRRAADERAIAAALSEPDVHARVQQLDRLLAGNPALEGAGRLAPVYEEAADAALASGDAARAGQLLRKAAKLCEATLPTPGFEITATSDTPAAATHNAARPAKAQALRVRALLAEASVPELRREGRRMLLASAQQLAPEDPRIGAALEQLEHPEGAATPARWAPVGGLVLGLWGLGALGSWRRRRREPLPA